MNRRDLIRFLGGGMCAAVSSKLLGVSPEFAESGPARDGAEPKPNDGRQHCFALGAEDFLLDGKPFQIRCGEMHPARIPREYWRQRMQFARAMGLNTISFCVFWNAHEEEEGKFDFKCGELDIGEYLQIAQEEGLWVFLRPGPYVCSEWDLGGLPWWLLRTPDIRLRCSDPRFTGPVERYFHELAKVIRPHVVENGGSILLVQIENEYGSYPRRDHDYLVWLGDLWVREGIKSPFITADGAAEHYLKGVTIPGVAIGLDPGENEADFALAHKMSPGVPVMSTETYPGWLRHWGEGWWEPTDVSGLLKFYMDTRKSFSLYMFHGGTNFGFHAGANGNDRDLTSYDYAAPVNEQGRPTPAYFAYRKQLAFYLPAGQSLPEVPTVIPTMEIPSIRLERWSGLWEQLPKPVTSEQPQCFESLGQNQGLVLYRARIPGGVSGKLTTILHGDPTIYVEGLLTQNLDLPARDKEAILEILVQAMGHINFLIEMDGDRKGLLGPVKVGDAALKNWEMFCFPLKSNWIMSLPRMAPGRMGGIFKGEFELDDVADTYLDMSNYKKGMLWVNGGNLGYHWSARGPQHRLYCPGPWLKKGVNTIVVLDTELTEPQPVTGVRTAR
ncbi:MAG: beta-galactosidase [Terriglobia bacterium]